MYIYIEIICVYKYNMCVYICTFLKMVDARKCSKFSPLDVFLIIFHFEKKPYNSLSPNTWIIHPLGRISLLIGCLQEGNRAHAEALPEEHAQGGEGIFHKRKDEKGLGVEHDTC